MEFYMHGFTYRVLHTRFRQVYLSHDTGGKKEKLSKTGVYKAFHLSAATRLPHKTLSETDHNKLQTNKIGRK